MPRTSLCLKTDAPMRTLLALMLLLAAWTMPLVSPAQDVDLNPLDDYIGQVNGRCPIDLGEEWYINGLAIQADTVVLALKVPSSIKYFLSELTGDSDNVKRLWLRQLKQFADVWTPLLDLLRKEGRPFRLDIMLGDLRPAAALRYSPADLDQGQ